MYTQALDYVEAACSEEMIICVLFLLKRLTLIDLFEGL